ncbi:MAG: nitrate reductase [Oscillospiraceae bacterium]|nr:nitrate reductase [Oscillospiraceae bacterium]
MKRIMIETEKCKGCKNCAIACMKAHMPDGVPFSLTDTRLEARNVILLDKDKQYRPLFCRHCDNPSCIKSCMSGAMTKDSATGHVYYDPKQCAGCFMCVMSCPFGVLKPDRATKTTVIKCDFCKDHGSEPSCVKQCINQAIHVEEV